MGFSLVGGRGGRGRGRVGEEVCPARGRVDEEVRNDEVLGVEETVGGG
jgi:hypothetical protein